MSLYRQETKSGQTNLVSAVTVTRTMSHLDPPVLTQSLRLSFLSGATSASLLAFSCTIQCIQSHPSHRNNILFDQDKSEQTRDMTNYECTGGRNDPLVLTNILTIYGYLLGSCTDPFRCVRDVPETGHQPSHFVSASKIQRNRLISSYVLLASLCK